MDKINVFKNGAEMPWTYYQADILANATTGNDAEGRNRLMFTSESKPGPNGESAGSYVSQIKRFIKFGNNNTFQEQVKNNPTAADYADWGWKLKSDPVTGEPVMPKYGEFAFKPGMEPSYEDVSSMNVEFRFGFGLNNTCYNFANEEVIIQVYNLSCQPKVFCTTNQFCEIVYDSATGTWGPDLIPEEADGNSICCDVTEGNNNEAYLMMCVEAGEQLRIEFQNYNTDLSKGQIELRADEVGPTADFSGEDYAALDDLERPYRSNVNGDSSIAVAGNIKYDFFRVRMRATECYRNLKYVDGKLCVCLKLTPIANGEALTSFSRFINVYLNLVKDTSVPGFRDANMATQRFEMETSNFPTYNRRARVVVTDEEAIHYAVRNNEGPSFIRGKTAEEALYTYRRSLLTETEKCLDDYKLSFNSLGMKKKLAHFIVTDLSSTAYYQGIDYDQSDISNILDNEFVQESYNANLAANAEYLRPGDDASSNLGKNLSIDDLYADTTTASCFQKVVNLLTSDKKVEDASDIDDNFDPMRPWCDVHINKQRQFGDLSTMNSDGDLSGYEKNQHTLMGAESTILVLLYAICNYNKTGSDTLINKYINRINDDQSTGGDDNNNISTFGNSTLGKLIKAMNVEYHGFDISPNDTAQGIADSKTHSRNRPSGLFDELYSYRHSINPMEGRSARTYISKMLTIIDKTDCDHIYYGTDELFTVNGLVPKVPGKEEIEALLYNGDLTTVLIGENKFIDTTQTNVTNFQNVVLIDEEEDRVVGNPLFMTPAHNQIDVSDGHNKAVFYLDYNHATTAGTIMGQHGGANNYDYQFAKTLGAANADVSNVALEGKWVFNINGTADMSQAYAEGKWHPENCDLSGLIKLPDSSNGCYFDFYVNGKLVRETCVDTHAVFTTDRYTCYSTDGSGNSRDLDMSNDADYYSTSDTETNANYHFDKHSSTMKNLLRVPNSEFLKKLDIVEEGIYAFYRVGNAVKFLANVEDLDAETDPAMKFPTFEIRERGDTTGECKLVIDDAYVPLKDFESTLELTMNLARCYCSGYQIDSATGQPNQEWFTEGFDADTSAVRASRWSRLCIPIDISGELERGEEFTFDIKYDAWYGSNIDYKADNSVELSAFSNMFTDNSANVPAICADQVFKFEYRNHGETEFKNACGVKFVYECHNKNKTMDSDFYSNGSQFGDFSGVNDGDYARSSNIKGLPEFRICLPAQNKLLGYYNNMGAVNNNDEENAFGTVGRFAQLQLNYCRTAKRTTIGGLDTDGNNKTLDIKVFVESDDYDADIRVACIDYDNYNQPCPYTYDDIRGEGTIDTDYTSGIKSGYMVGPAVKEGPGPKQQCVPDYSKRQVYEFGTLNFNDASGSNVRLFDMVCCNIKENNFGPEKPIASIKAANFIKADGKYSFGADIAPIFRLDADERQYIKDGTYCNIQNLSDASSVNGDLSDVWPRLIPANTNYAVMPSEDHTEFRLYRTNNINYEEWVGGAGDLYTYNNYWNGSQPYSEIVNVKLTYYEPETTYQTINTDSVVSSMGVRKEVNLVFLVEPQDCKELVYPKTFCFEVDECEKSVDITSLLSATIEGQSHEDIKYYIAGVFDESGQLHYYNSVATKYTDNTENSLAKMLAEMCDTAVAEADNAETLTDTSGIVAGLTFNSKTDGYNVNSEDIGSNDLSNVDLNTLVVNGKLTIYHKDHLNSAANAIASKQNNPWFDAYDKRDYRFLILAEYQGRDQQSIENCVSVVNIKVRHAATGFYLADGYSWSVPVN